MNLSISLKLKSTIESFLFFDISFFERSYTFCSVSPVFFIFILVPSVIIPIGFESFEEAIKSQEQKTKGDVVTQAKSNNDFSKINTKMGNTNSDTKNQEVIFKVQIISSSVPLATNSPKFRGLKNAWEYKDGGLYKYTVGNQKDLKSAYALQSEFRSKGFGEAFVVSFKDGERTPMREALRLLN